MTAFAVFRETVVVAQTFPNNCVKVVFCFQTVSPDADVFLTSMQFKKVLSTIVFKEKTKMRESAFSRGIQINLLVLHSSAVPWISNGSDSPFEVGDLNMSINKWPCLDVEERRRKSGVIECNVVVEETMLPAIGMPSSVVSLARS